jgi:hypothetical protein
MTRGPLPDGAARILRGRISTQSQSGKVCGNLSGDGCRQNVKPATTSSAKPVYQMTILVGVEIFEDAATTTKLLIEIVASCKSMELPMKNNASGPGRDEHKIMRTWRIGVVAFYGSMLAILISLSAVGDRAIRIAGNAPASSTFETAAPR